jgi:hypothetical protein
VPVPRAREVVLELCAELGAAVELRLEVAQGAVGRARVAGVCAARVFRVVE